MTRQQALLTHLKTGGKLSIKTAYNYFGVSNISREIRRLVEKPFNIELIREKKHGKTKYGSPCVWYEYSASKSTQKKIAGILKTLKK